MSRLGDWPDRVPAGGEPLTPECIEAGPALLRQAFIESGQQPSEEAICRIVDNVLIPMLRANPS